MMDGVWVGYLKFVEEYVDERLFWVRRSRLCLQGCDPEKPQQEVARLSYLALPIRRIDPLLNTCRNEGQEVRVQQEAAVREKAGHLFFEVHCHSGEESGQALQGEGARGCNLHEDMLHIL